MFLNEVCILKMLNFDRIDFLKKLMLIKQMHQRNVIFLAIGVY